MGLVLPKPRGGCAPRPADRGAASAVPAVTGPADLSDYERGLRGVATHWMAPKPLNSTRATSPGTTS